MAPKTDFPPVRACLFDMDGLLLNTEDIYTHCINTILARYGRPDMPWSIKAKLQGRPMIESNKLFMAWSQLPIPLAQFQQENADLQAERFPEAVPLPGVDDLLKNLGRTRYWEHAGSAPNGTASSSTGHRVHIALATSSQTVNFHLKTTHLTDLFSVFEAPRRVLGDDPRIAPGRGKPLPDIYLLALKTINETLSPGEPPITPEECLVFEDSVPGVESGRRAGMRVVWCPHPDLKVEYAGREPEVLAGATGEAGADGNDTPHGAIDDGWSEYIPTLENFPYEHYGIVVPPADVENEPFMKAATEDAKVIVTESGTDKPAA